jgi:hypothetical protein
MRVRALSVLSTTTLDRVVTRSLDHFVDVDPVRSGGVQPENPGAQLRGYLRVTASLLERV